MTSPPFPESDPETEDKLKLHPYLVVHCYSALHVGNKREALTTFRRFYRRNRSMLHRQQMNECETIVFCLPTCANHGMLRKACLENLGFLHDLPTSTRMLHGCEVSECFTALKRTKRKESYLIWTVGNLMRCRESQPGFQILSTYLRINCVCMAPLEVSEVATCLAKAASIRSEHPRTCSSLNMERAVSLRVNAPYGGVKMRRFHTFIQEPGDRPSHRHDILVMGSDRCAGTPLNVPFCRYG